MPTPFRTTRRIEFADTDMAGIVHFANFFRFMEAAEVEFLRARGLSVSLSWDGQKIGFPRVSASCDYTKPARFEDVLDVSVQLANVGRKSVTFAFEFSKNGQTIARGQVSSVCCRVLPDHGLESIEIPASYRARLESDPA
jgi:YbgC/YbaW family acyl-CoA thioester hydrolase